MDLVIPSLQQLAPTEASATDYDRRHLATYAALLDSDQAGEPWNEAASEILGIDPAKPDARACWQSHLDRARWIIGDGLGDAIATFGRRPSKAEH